MKKISIDFWGCCKAICPYQNTCAQHRSAGLDRQAYGFSPELYRDRMEILCKSYGTKEAEGCIGDCGYPENVNDLLKGYTRPEDIHKTLD